MQYLLHRIFGWNFDSMSLEVRSESSRCSYQRSSQSSVGIVDRLLYSVPFSD